MKFIGTVTPTLAAVAVSTVLGVGGGAFAATTLVHTNDIANKAVTSTKIAPGAVNQSKLTPTTVAELGQTKANAKSIAALQDQVKALQDALTGSWNTDAGQVTPTAHGLAVTEASTDTAGAGASNLLVREYKAGQKIEVSGTLTGGAEAGQGAPRAYIIIDGVVYTSLNNVNPDYGTNAAGTTFDESLVPVSYDGKPAPSGLITQVGVAYDNTSAPGTATFTSLTIGGTSIPLN